MKTQFRPPSYVEGLRELIEKLPSGINGIEVGSAYGESAEVFLKSGKFAKLYCIDPWNGSASEREQYFDERHANDPRVVKIKKKASDAVDDVPMADFVYIDACHQYDFVSEDIKNYRKKVKKGGYLAGHDYTYEYRDMVIRAVHEVFRQPHYVFRDGSWLVKL